MSIEQVPLEWCYGPGVVIDCSHKKPAEFITKADLMAALDKIPYQLKRNDIVLLRTDASKHFDNPQFPNLQPGLHPEGCHWLLDQGIRMIGIDAWGLDRAPRDMAADHKKGIPNSLWPTHLVGRDREYLQIERLANLEALPPTGFTVVACPVKGCLAVRPPQPARSRRWLRPVVAAVLAVAIYGSVVVAFRAAGHWRTAVSESEYHARLQEIDSPAYVHPGGTR
jgi:kynurenine formamidase